MARGSRSAQKEETTNTPCPDGNLRRGRKCIGPQGWEGQTLELTAPTPEPNPTEEESKEQAASQSVGCLTLQCICPSVKQHRLRSQVESSNNS